MATHSPPQPSVSASPAKPAPPSGAARHSGLGAATAKPVREGTLYHLLVERGWDAELAYTADQRIRAMTSETAAAGLQPVLEELRQMREAMAGFATKEDLAGFATQADMAKLEARLIKWMFGAMLAQTAVIVGFVVGVVPLLK